MSGHGTPTEFAAPAECAHTWHPVSMVFETQLLDDEGRVLIRQPDLDVGRVYLVCLDCATHTYMTTQWLGARLHGSEDAIPAEHRGAVGKTGWDRPAWTLGEGEQ